MIIVKEGRQEITKMPPLWKMLENKQEYRYLVPVIVQIRW